MPATWCPDEAERKEVTPDLLWVLAQERNRRVLRYFWESDVDEVPLENLANHLADRFEEGPFSGPSDKVELQLYHATLPNLAHHDLIKFDWEANIVRCSPDQALPDDLMDDVFALDDDD